MRKVWKIGSRWDDNGTSGTSILDTVFIPNGIVFATTTLCLEIMEGDLFAVADGYKILAIAEALSPAFRMDRLNPSLHDAELSDYMDPNNYGCKVHFWRLDDDSQFDYKKQGKLLVGGDDLVDKVNNLFDNLKDDGGAAIVNQPIVPLDKATTEKIDRILNRAMRVDDDDPRSRICAIRLYEEATTLGGVEAFVKLEEIGSEINSLFLGNINQELDRIAMPAKDRQYIKDRADKDFSELQEGELAMMLKIANEYGVLHAAVESMVSDIEEATDALDDDWMHSNGHDDGETFD